MACYEHLRVSIKAFSSVICITVALSMRYRSVGFSTHEASISCLLRLLGYGLVVPLALLGAWRTIRCRDQRKLFLIVWIIAVSALVYAPLLLQRRMVEGLHIALCVLATYGLANWLPQIVNRSRLAQLIERRLRYPRQR